MKTSRNDARKSKFLEIEKYHRFFLFGSHATEEVYAMFTDTAADTHNLLRYNSSLHPGATMDILNAQVEGLLRATNTTLLSSIEPLVPQENIEVRNLALPHSLEMASFRSFEFTNTTLTIRSATATENVCPSYTCDAQTVLQTCGCLSVATKKTWALILVVQCEEL